MKNISKPLVIIVLVALIGMGGYLLYSRQQPISGTEQSASVFNVSTGSGSIYFLDFGLGRGKCVRVFFDSNNNPVGAYTGTWNGSYDCTPAKANNVSTTNLFSVNKNTNSTTITTKDPGAYYANPASLMILQTKLSTAGFLDSTLIDGKFSQKTFDAIKALQVSKNISPTGYLDSATLTALDKIILPKPTLVTPITPTKR